MRLLRLVFALAFVVTAAAAMGQAQGQGHAPTNISPPTVHLPPVPPTDPPDSIIGYLCKVFGIPYLCK
jgi:hypothetical protein